MSAEPDLQGRGGGSYLLTSSEDLTQKDIFDIYLFSLYSVS